jgi:hypothetical protein
MSRDQDLLFCKIAIQSGKLTQEVAQQCLTLANRFEAEGKRRPQVGALFLQQNLLSKEDVQRIYGAVQKRMESHSPSAEDAASAAAAIARGQRQAVRPPAARAAARPGAPAVAGHSRAVRVAHRQAETKIEVTQLYLGIGFGVVFLICIGALIFILVNKKPEEMKVSTGGILPRQTATSTTTPPAASPAVLPEKTPAKAAADTKAAIEKAIGRTPADAKKAEDAAKAAAGAPGAAAVPDDKHGGPGGAEGKTGVE